MFLCLLKHVQTHNPGFSPILTFIRSCFRTFHISPGQWFFRRRKSSGSRGWVMWRIAADVFGRPRHARGFRRFGGGKHRRWGDFSTVLTYGKLVNLSMVVVKWDPPAIKLQLWRIYTLYQPFLMKLGMVRY